MTRWLGPLAVFALFAGGAHWLVLDRAPSVIMGAAMDKLAERGVPLHRFALSPPMTPQTQTVVRPAPDLSYSVCRFDFAELDGPLRVRMGAYDGYSSLSFFDSETNNFATVRGDGEAREVVLLAPRIDTTGDALTAPTQTGVILIRRLTPNAAARERVVAASAKDICAPAKMALRPLPTSAKGG